MFAKGRRGPQRNRRQRPWTMYNSWLIWPNVSAGPAKRAASRGSRAKHMTSHGRAGWRWGAPRYICSPADLLLQMAWVKPRPKRELGDALRSAAALRNQLHAATKPTALRLGAVRLGLGWGRSVAVPCSRRTQSQQLPKVWHRKLCSLRWRPDSSTQSAFTCMHRPRVERRIAIESSRPHEPARSPCTAVVSHQRVRSWRG